MKTVKLDKEELTIEKEFDQFKPAQKSIKNKFENIISESRKSRPISLRINEQDLSLLKDKANRNGLPYQTMINVIIHRYVNDSFLDIDEIDKYLKFKATAIAAPAAKGARKDINSKGRKSRLQEKDV